MGHQTLMHQGGLGEHFTNTRGSWSTFGYDLGLVRKGCKSGMEGFGGVFCIDISCVGVLETNNLLGCIVIIFFRIACWQHLSVNVYPQTQY